MSVPVSSSSSNVAGRARVLSASVALRLLLVLDVSHAAAFCRESLKSSAGGDCEEDPGVAFLVWKRGCMTYRFNEHFFDLIPALSQAAVRDVFLKSFDAWAKVDCGASGMPFF